jgi:hypothetical protein
MIFALIANNALDAIGLTFIVLTTIKIARGYPVSRWFF